MTELLDGLATGLRGNNGKFCIPVQPLGVGELRAASAPR